MPSISARKVLTTRAVDLRLARAVAARGHQAVDLVDEDYARRDLARAGEQAG